MPHRALARRIAAAALAAACVCALPGCSSGPSVSGFGLFNNRNVSVGDTVTISMPYDAAKGETWRLSSYDSAFLQPIGRPQVTQPGEPGKLTYTVQLEAKLPGETDVTLTGTSIDSNGQRQTEHVTYTVRIFPN